MMVWEFPIKKNSPAIGKTVKEIEKSFKIQIRKMYDTKNGIVYERKKSR